MIGFLAVVLSTIFFALIGYSLFTMPFVLFMNIMILIALIGIAFIAVAGLAWEFYFQQPAKNIIANRRAAAWELAVDDLGYAQLVPSKRYLPNGLVQWKFGWNLLPRPIRKLDIMQHLVGKRRGRPPKDPENAKKLEEQHQARERQLQEIAMRERELAEQLGLKKCTWKGIGKPIWLSYIGLAANFSPNILVPSEMKQDNPHQYVQQIRDYITGLSEISDQMKKDLLTKVNALEERVDHVRVVLDPRRFKEVFPDMVTQSQLDDHGRIHEEIGRLSVNGMPLGKILMILLLIGLAVGGLAAVYFLFLKPQQPQPQQAASILWHLLKRQ